MPHPLLSRRFPIFFAAALGLLAGAPKTTPTPEPVLTGGFGKTPPTDGSRQSMQKTKILITNSSLVTDPGKGKLTTSEVKPGATPTEPRASVQRASPAPGEGGEEYWRGEARRLRERVAALKETIAQLEAETKKLEGDFYSRDPAYWERVIKPAWDKAREALVTARRELPVAEKELADDLPNRARKAGAPPGWLRE